MELSPTDRVFPHRAAPFIGLPLSEYNTNGWLTNVRRSDIMPHLTSMLAFLEDSSPKYPKQ